MKASVAAQPPQPNCPPKGTQAKAYDALKQSANDGWKSFLCDRVDRLAPGAILDWSHEVRDRILEVGKIVGPGVMQTVIKTITNSWAMSHRSHEEVRLGCIFGCQGCVDTLEHYLVCDPFWTILVSCAKLSAEWLSLSAFRRLAILSPSPTAFNLMAIASRSYHAIRLDHTEKVLASHWSKDYRDIIELLILHARVHAADLL